MKYIFDFDDVLFNNTKEFKEHMYACLSQVGVSTEKAIEYYQTVREKEFSLLDFITTLINRENTTGVSIENVYKKIMSKCSEFTNKDLVEFAKEAKKENCFMISNGGKKFQEDKIEKSGVGKLFSKIYIVPSSKKEIVYEICKKYKDEQVVFIEDKIKFIEDIDLAKCSNLKTILFQKQTVEELKSLLLP